MSSAEATKPVADQDAPLPIPNLAIAQLVFALNGPSTRDGETVDRLLELCTKDEMAPYLKHLVESHQVKQTDATDSLVSRLERLNADHLAELDRKLQDATTNLGESEVADALRERATYLARIGKQQEAIDAHERAYEKSAGKGTKIDLVLSIVRIAMFHRDSALVASQLDRAQKLVDEGGDWDRRNRLKVYRAVHLLSVRQFTKASELLLDALPTFTATELLEYDDFVTLCVLAGVFSLERKDLKSKIIESPEVISVLPNVPSLRNFTDSLYKTDYATFFKSLATVEEQHFLTSRLLSPHSKYYTRELRLKAYSQLLESYRSVTLDSLSKAFGVSKEWLDADLARFIASGRLNCSIDRVGGVVETHRPSIKNARYAKVIKNGDQVLTSVQRLSRVIG
ncbi:uncharacterized protein JCM15063_001696 [Sporobolomyces koalae]|uniref:uncharacterized protein n=1 Tax=Sporobolomyces koalae TaxID=500713 RepID=UPI0031766401